MNEGDEVNVTCSAPEEPGSLHIYFYKNNQEFQLVRSRDNSATISVKVDEAGNFFLHCNYMLMHHPSAGISNNSNTVNIYVQGKVS